MVESDGYVYRCINRRRWASGHPFAHVPVMGLPAEPGRWNPTPQWALYTSHREHVAVEEKRRHRAGRAGGVVRSIRAALPDPFDDAFIVIGFQAPEVVPDRTFDGRTVLRAVFDPCLSPSSYREAHRLAWEYINAGMSRLVVPSCPCPDEWNSVFYYFSPGQLTWGDLPSRANVQVIRDVRLP